jgi:uncharacterized protein (TIGR02001 family)
MAYRLILAAAVAAASAGAAWAQDEDGGDEAAFALSYGATLTSNYIFRGATQSDDKPALQGYVEGGYGILYGAVWASTVDFGGDDQIEIDLTAGVRPTIGDLSLDINYTRYVYDDTGDCCGEIILLAAYPVSEAIETAGGFYWDPELETEWLEVGTAVYFADVWAAGGTIGTDFGSLGLGNDKVAWDLGVSRYVGDYVTLDLRYYDSNDDPASTVVSISADF